MKQLSKIKRLNLRDVWAKEASDFTPWLAENIEEPQFATVVGLMLADAQGTHHAGHVPKSAGGNSKAMIQNASGFISKFINRFKA